MSTQVLLVGLICLAAGAGISYLLFKPRIDSVRDQLAHQKETHARELERVRDGGLSVLSYPYKEEFGENGFFTDERRAEVGYKFQVFVAGVPSFEPHKIPTEIFSKKEVNAERIEQALQKAMEMVETLASRHPAFVAMKAAPLAKMAAK